MRHALTYSIIDLLRNQVPEVSGRVTWIYDGVSITGDEKPLLTIESIAENDELMSAGRLDFSEVYAWQVGVFTRTVAERERLSETVKTVLRQRSIPFLDTRGSVPAETGRTFVADVIRVVPMPADDIANETNRHRSYIDVEVAMYRVNGDSLNFTQ